MLYKYKYFWNCTRDIVFFTDSDFSKRASKRGSKYGCCAAVLYKLFLTLRYMKFIVAMCSNVRMKNGLEFRISRVKLPENRRVYSIIVRGNFISKSHTCSNRVYSTIVVALGGRSCHVFALRAAATLEIALSGG